MINLRIVHLLSDLSVSSAASGVINLMRWQQAHEQDALLVTAAGERLADVSDEKLAFQLIDKKAFKLQRKHLDRIEQQIARWGADVIHAHRIDCLPLATYLSKKLDIPLILNLQRCIDQQHASALRDAPLVWLQVPSQAIRAYCINELGIERDRVVVLPFALHSERLTPWQRQQRPKIELIGAVGSFDDIHGFEQICRAMRQLHEDGLRLKAMFIGSGSGQSRLTRVIKHCNLQEHISIVCGSPQIGRFLSIMDALVYPAADDAMSVVLMKAMACQLPVIAPALGGIPEIVQHDRTGYLIPELTQSALVTEMVRMIKDPEQAQRMACEGKRMLEACYSTNAIGTLYGDLYENAIQGERHSTATRAVSTAFTRKTETALAS